MKSSVTTLPKIKAASILFDFFAVAFIYLVPSLSHLLNIPLYLLEPMRIMVIIAMIHTNRSNAYVLALTLPMFSYFVSGHPVVLKTALISIELLLNVALFFTLKKTVRSPFFAMMLAILLSKVVYYGLKASLINFTFLHSELFSTPLTLQLIMMLLFSGYAFFWSRKKM